MGDLFGASPMPAQEAQKQMFAFFEDSNLQIETETRRSPVNPQEFSIRAYFSSKTG